MPIKKTTSYRGKDRKVREYFRRFNRVAGSMAVDHFKRSFLIKGWMDEGVRKWRPRKAGAKRNKGRGLLIDKGRLRRSIRILALGPGLALVVSDTEYSDIHNNGGQIRRMVTVKQHKRRITMNIKSQSTNLETKRTSTRKVKVSVGEATVMRHQRHMNLFIPQRKFMGNSGHLNRRINQRVLIDLRKMI